MELEETKQNNRTRQLRESQFHFSAGSGACVYQKDITLEHLKRCWEHPEYQCACKTCGKTAYVYKWAGNCTAGGYWLVRTWCPECNSYHVFHYNDIKPISIHWTEMRRIIEEEQQ